MKLLNTEQTNWDENIKLELTLRELQIIRDSIGATNHETRSDIWNWSDNFKDKDCPYNSQQGTYLFNDVNYILKKQGGATFE